MARGSHRVDDPDTSVEAALSVDADVLEEAVCQVLRQEGPMTTEEIANVLDTAIASITPRMRPLEKKLKVRRTDERRKGESGKNRIVWELLPPGEEPTAPSPKSCVYYGVKVRGKAGRFWHDKEKARRVHSETPDAEFLTLVAKK